MKKFLLSGLVLGIFALYAIHTKLGGADNPVVAINSPITIGTPARNYKDGTFTGSVADAFYGNIQVQAVISGGKITDVVFLQYPNDRNTSIYINSQAMPLLKQEAIQVQSEQVDGVSGATASSGAFVQSLGSALQKAV
jgi:uncharacterized protein with FMN-binding domain